MKIRHGYRGVATEMKCSKEVQRVMEGYRTGEYRTGESPETMIAAILGQRHEGPSSEQYVCSVFVDVVDLKLSGELLSRP